MGYKTGESRSMVELEDKMIKISLKGEAEEGKVISLRNVTVSYLSGTRDILKNVSMDIDSPEKIGIVGKNGSGKSTLLRLGFQLS